MEGGARGRGLPEGAMYRRSFRPPTPPAPDGSGFLSPPPGGTSPQGYRSPHTPPYGHRSRPYDISPRSPRFQPCGESGTRFGGPAATPAHTPRRPHCANPWDSGPYSGGRSPGEAFHLQQPFKQPSSGGYRRYSQGTSIISSPFGTPHGKEKILTRDDVENYYKPSMLKDPWAGLQPVSVTDVSQQFSMKQTTYSGRRGRYFS